MADEKTLSFDWHEENRKRTGAGSFLAWAVITMVEARKDDEAFKTIEALSDGFQNLTMEIRLNGVQVDAGKFMRCLEENMDRATKKEAEELVKRIEGLSVLYDALHKLEEGFKREVEKTCAEAGIKFDEEGWSL